MVITSEKHIETVFCGGEQDTYMEIMLDTIMRGDKITVEMNYNGVGYTQESYKKDKDVALVFIDIKEYHNDSTAEACTALTVEKARLLANHILKVCNVITESASRRR